MFLGILIAACWQHVALSCELRWGGSITHLSSAASRTAALRVNREETDWETARGQPDTGRILDWGDLLGNRSARTASAGPVGRSGTKQDAAGRGGAAVSQCASPLATTAAEESEYFSLIFMMDILQCLDAPSPTHTQQRRGK